MGDEQVVATTRPEAELLLDSMPAQGAGQSSINAKQNWHLRKATHDAQGGLAEGASHRLGTCA